MLYEVITGGALLKGLDKLISRETQLHVIIDEDPLTTRITSYNVCYTKLLRGVLADEGGLLAHEEAVPGLHGIVRGVQVLSVERVAQLQAQGVARAKPDGLHEVHRGQLFSYNFV